jgi:hypothetical protein
LNFTTRAHLNEQIDNMNLTIASQPDAKSFRDNSSDIFDEFVIGIADEDFADLAENIFNALQNMQ